MSSLRGVLDEKVMRKEKLLKQCLPTDNALREYRLVRGVGGSVHE